MYVGAESGESALYPSLKVNNLIILYKKKKIVHAILHRFDILCISYDNSREIEQTHAFKKLIYLTCYQIILVVGVNLPLDFHSTCLKA